MANTSKRISRLLNRSSVHKTAVAVRLPKGLRKTAFKESRKPYRVVVLEPV
jgi:hypothetical protein